MRFWAGPVDTPVVLEDSTVSELEPCDCLRLDCLTANSTGEACKWASPAFSLRREAPMPEGFFFFTLSLILLSALIWQIVAGFV